MFQDILALLTVTGAIIYMVWGIYKVLTPSKNQHTSLCSGCTSNGCSVSTIKQKSKG
jgi:hypothetical protein